ncbi:OmpA family protein [Dactylosporangium matsuzakiense]|uniref:OmpA family protein n=1 Tax=Dactylosporangium matsuzakiense TaxID=53360 RepID=UPI0022F309DC|nr:OmpA family protein [Dactylosporangium matsuzakiense]
MLLADGSASAFARPDADKRSDWGAELAGRLPTDGGGLVAIGVFGGAVEWKTQVVTPAKSRDAQRTELDFTDMRKCLTTNLSDAMKAVPSLPQSDILRALAEGAEYVRKWSGPKSLYLATDGLSNTGCADLRAASIGDTSEIPQIVSGCAAEIPKLDDSYTVTLLGVGNAAPGWSDIKTPQRTWIAALWKALCDASKAKCQTPDTAKPKTSDLSGVKPAADNDVTMPAIKVVTDGPTVVTVPASLLFDVDKFTLAPGRSQDVLQEIFKNLAGLHPKRIEVAGHTDSTGTPEHNRDLSRKRAETVAGELRAQNFPNVTTNGYASDRPACTPEYKEGKPDRIAMACNRRVEIIAYT